MKKHILVIEDDYAVNELILRSVDRSNDYTAEAAFNGREGLQAVRETPEPFDIVILDLSLPDIDGLEFIRYLAETRFAGGIIIASGHSISVLNAAKQLAGYHNITVLGTIQKPFSPAELRKIIQHASVPANTVSVDDRNRCGDIAGSQLVPYYQPQVDIKTGAVVGYEALIRLQLVDGPLVGPNLLFSHIRNPEERISTSLEISRLVLKDIEHASHESPYFPGVSINFDARVLENERAMAEFAYSVNAAGIDPSMITVEVIEKSLPESDAHLLEALTRLSMAGFRVSLDDYGAGGSNQDLLRRSPFNELKLDHKLIQSGLDDPVSRKFVATAVETARELGLQLIGEGVETRDQLDFVIDQGISVVQGFFFGRPMPISDAISFSQSKLYVPRIA